MSSVWHYMVVFIRLVNFVSFIEIEIWWMLYGFGRMVMEFGIENDYMLTLDNARQQFAYFMNALFSL